jgi:hypothetical protein
MKDLLVSEVSKVHSVAVAVGWSSADLVVLASLAIFSCLSASPLSFVVSIQGCERVFLRTIVEFTGRI